MSGAKQASTTEPGHAATHGRSLPRQGPARQLLATGATLTVLGILLSLGTPRGVAGDGLSGTVFVLGSGVLLLGLHRVGRLGPD